MKKSILMKLLVLAVCAAMLLSLFACGPEVETEPTEEPTQQETEGNNEKPTDNSTEAPTQAGGEDTDPTETDPTETDPVETEPTETDPEESKPAETDPEESKPAETDPETPSETTGTLPQESETQGNKPPVETDPACDGNHNYVAKGPQGHYCDKCGNPGRDNPILEHTYEDKDGVPTCSVCGYVADCKGEHTAYIGDETGHWTAPCDQCGAAAGTEISEHTYKYENDKYACTVCGWTLTCDGKHALVSDDEKGHHTAACDICNVPAGEIVAHVFANSVCECGYEAACKGKHDMKVDAEGHEIGDCDICGYKATGKQPHVWGAEYYTAGESYVYGCKECGYAKYTKVLTAAVKAFFAPVVIAEDKQTTYYNIGHASNTEGEVPFASFTGKGGAAQVLWMRAYEDTIYSNNAAVNEQEKLDIGKATYLVIKLRKNSADQKLVLQFSTTGKNSTTAVAEEVITNKDGKVLVEAGATYNTNNGYSSFTLPMTLAEVNEWTTFVIDLAKVTPDQMVLDSETNTYVVDTLYYHIDGFETEMTLDVAYMAFVEGGWTEIGENVDEETAVSVAQNNVGSVVDPATGGCVGEHVFTTTLVDGEYKSACSCGYVKTSYGIKEEGPNKLWGAEILATTGSVTGHLDKELCYDEDGTAYVRYDNFWPNRDNWGDFSIDLGKAVGQGGASGQYLVIKFRVGGMGTGRDDVGVFVNTNQSDKKNLVGQGETSFVKTNDNQWHTVVIDLSTRVKSPDVAFLPDADGSYNVRYFSIRPFGGAQNVQDDSAEGVRYFYTYWVREEDEEGKPILNSEGKETKTYKEQVLGKENRLTEEQMTEKGYNHELIYKYTLPADAYVDLSFIALCDSMDDIKNIVTAEQYEWSADGSTSALRNTADNSCVEHVYGEKVEGTTHNIVCALCGTPIRSFEVSADINWYAPLDKMDKYIGSLSKMNYDPDEQVMYNRYTGNKGNHLNVTGGYANPGVPTTDAFATGRYVVIKYRATNTSLGLNVATGDKKDGNGESLGTQSTANAPGNEWRVAVIDASQNKEWTSDGTAQTIYVMITTSPVEVEGVAQEYTVDIAYVAVVDSIGEMKTLLQKGETYFDYGTNFGGVGVEYYQDGTKVPCKEGECQIIKTPVVVDGEDGAKVYTYPCQKCGDIIYSRTVAAGATYFHPEHLDTRISGTVTNPDAAPNDQVAVKDNLFASVRFQTTGEALNLDPAPYYSFKGTASTNPKGTIQVIWNRSYPDYTSQSTNNQRYNIDLGQSKYFVIRARADIAAIAESPKSAFLSISTTGKDGYYTLYLPVGDFVDENGGQWVTYVADLSTIASDYWVQEDGKYLLDTFLIQIGNFYPTDSFAVEYMAFVEDWNDVKTLAGTDDKVVNITDGKELKYDMVDFSGVLPGTTPEKPVDVTFTNGKASANVYAGATMYFNVPAGFAEGIELFANGAKVEYVAGETGATFTITNDTEADVVYELVAALPGYSEYNATVIADEDYVADGEFATTVTVKVGAGETKYFFVKFDNNMVITLNGAPYEVVSGIAAVTNAGDAEAEFVIRGEYVVGCEKRPDTLVEGDNTVEIPEGTMKGYYYSYTAAKPGMLTITVNSTAGWSYKISRTSLGEEEQSILNYTANSGMEDADVWNPVTVQVEEGEVITVWVITFDPEASVNPAGTVTVNARFVEDHECVSDAAFACVEGKCTICGEPMEPVAGHTEPVDGYCTVCHTKIAFVEVTKETIVKENYEHNGNSITWTMDGFTVVAEGNDNCNKPTAMGVFEVPTGYTVTVSANKITKVVFTASKNTEASKLQGATFADGVTVEVDGATVIITVNEGSTLDEISIVINESVKIKKISVSYMG